MLKVTKNKNKEWDKISKTLKDLDRKILSVGHYEEDGLHGLSDLTYPELLAIWSFGEVPTHEGTIKDPRLEFIITHIAEGKLAVNGEVKRIIKQWAEALTNPTANIKLLDTLGESLVEQYKDIFGKVGTYMPAVGNNNTPMLFTGELQDATRYKVIE